MHEILKQSQANYRTEAMKYQQFTDEIRNLEERQQQLTKQLEEAHSKVESLTRERSEILQKIVSGGAAVNISDKVSTQLADVKRKADDLAEVLTLTAKTIDLKREAVRELNPRGCKAAVFSVAAKIELEAIKPQLLRIMSLARAGASYILQEQVSEILGGSRARVTDEEWNQIEAHFIGGGA